jgi:antitoxin (DNA-binding transcriptional repressor) of toxin-antitoxin stability system
MSTVGIRELKARLSAYIRQVRSGRTILVTDHGEVVAELRAPTAGAAGGVPRKWLEAVTDGSLVPALQPGDRSWLTGPGAGLPAGTAAQLLEAERGE